MSDYSQVNDYSAKDALATGNPEKLILGSDIDDELSALSVAIATKYDSADLASQAQAEAETVNTVLMTPLRVANWADYNAGIVGDLQALTDPNADRILGWDDSAGAAIGFALSTGLTTSGTNLLIDTTVVPQLSGQNVFTATNTISNTGPTLRLNETDAAADNRLWDFFASGEVLYFRVVDDAVTSGVGWMTVNRTANTVDSVAIAATAITLNGVDVTDYARLSQQNTFTGSTAGQRIHIFANTNTGTTAYQDVSLRDSTGGSVEFKMTLAGSGYTSSLVTSGPTGQSAALRTIGAIPIALATNNSARMVIDSSGNFDFKAGTVTTTNSTASEVGYKGTPQNAQTTNYTLALTDAGKTIKATSTMTQVTVPDDAAVDFPDGTVVRIHNRTGSDITVTKTTSSGLIQNGTAATGSRTLPNNSVCEVYKSQDNEWIISGPTS